MAHWLRFLPAAALFVGAAAACANSDTSLSPDDAGAPTGDAAAEETGKASDASTSDTTPSAKWCDALGAKQERCDGVRECGTAFTSWCAAQSKTNSLAFEQADAVCLANGCDSKSRSDCRYRAYQESSLTAAQNAFITAYCGTCPSANCEASLRTYDVAKGPNGVSDAYVAAWELSDAITTDIRLSCTGAALALDAGGDCVKAFGSCAADHYLNALPSCP